MKIIDHLETTLTAAIAGDDPSVADVSLLEQFYAILVTRLASAQIYSQLLSSQTSSESNHSVFEQIWSDIDQRQLIVTELAATHHVDEMRTEQLLNKATHLGYVELKNLADGQFLPAFLQTQQASIREYLPVWAASAISAPIPITQAPLIGADRVAAPIIDIEPLPRLSENEPVVAVVKEVISVNDEGDLHSTIVTTSFNEPKISIVKESTTVDSGAIHANPSDYHTSEVLIARPSRKPSNSWIIPLLLLIIALTALALLWFLVIQPKLTPPIAPVVAQPVPVVIEEKIAIQLTPAELTVGIDNSGGLLTCTATVGDIALQDALRQALNTSFGEQISICELKIEKGVATDLGNLTIGTLPQVLTLMRATPFARLQLQQNSLSLEAPDNRLLQQLASDIRALLSTMTIAAPMILADSTDANTGNFDNSLNNEFNNGLDNMDNSTGINSQQPIFQASDDDTNDRVIPAQPRNNDIDNRNTLDNRNSNNNNVNQQRGSISVSEVESLANNSIVAEPLRNARPVE